MSSGKAIGVAVVSIFVLTVSSAIFGLDVNTTLLIFIAYNMIVCILKEK